MLGLVRHLVYGLAAAATAAPSPRTPKYEDKACATTKIASAVAQSKRTIHYCDTCRREFKDETALQMHVKTSQDHQKKLQSQPARGGGPGVPAAAASGVGAMKSAPSVTPLPPGHQRLNGAASQPAATDGGWVRFEWGGNRWLVVPPARQSAALKALSRNCHSPEDLLRHHYLLRPYTAGDIAGLSRCKNCGGLQKNIQYHGPRDCYFHTGTQDLAGQPYNCCGETNRGCSTGPAHIFGKPDRQIAKKYREYAPTPPHSGPMPKSLAVTLDCEMAGLLGNRSEVILLCAADYFTGKTIINTFVRPTGKVIDWRTRYSGVTARAMSEAIAQGRTLNGWKEARAELWKYIGPDTILVGQSLQNDLDVLRMVHTRVVDSGIMAKNAVAMDTRQWGLKLLCKEILGIDIQNKGKKGHDCLEDALAAREVVLCCTLMPQKLQQWGKVARKREQLKLREQEKEREKERKQRELQKKA